MSHQQIDASLAEELAYLRRRMELLAQQLMDVTDRAVTIEAAIEERSKASRQPTALA
jgi:hypothetical protein